MHVGCRSSSVLAGSSQELTKRQLAGRDFAIGRPDVFQGLHVLGLWASKTISGDQSRWQLALTHHSRLLQGAKMNQNLRSQESALKSIDLDNRET